MPQGFGHPPQWDHRLPRVDNLLAPIPPATRPATAPMLLPPPSQDPRGSPYGGSQSLARHGSPWASACIPPDRRQDSLQARSPVAYLHDDDRPSHYSLASEYPTFHPLHSPSVPTQRQDPGSRHSPCPSFGPVVPSYTVDGGSDGRATHPTRGQGTACSAPSRTLAEQSSWPQPAAGTVPESRWGYTKAGKARKRLEQACVHCRKKKTRCEPTDSSSKCGPCKKSGSDCYFDSA
jgi:hypothetical protein